MRWILLLVPMTACLWGAGSWKPLFDGHSLKGWRTPSGTTAGLASWSVDSGTLHSVARASVVADLWTKESYGDFELSFEWKVAPGGNSGIKYLIQQWGSGQFRNSHQIRKVADALIDNSGFQPGDQRVEYTLGFEYQVVDDFETKPPRRGVHSSAALYDLLAPAGRDPRQTGEWNQGLLVVKGDHIEHWLNGERVVAYDLNDPAFRAKIAVDARGFRFPTADQLTRRRTPIALQHHLTDVWFRNLKIRTR